MATSFGGTVKLQGETEYRKALSQIQQNLREVSSEMKVVNSSFSANDKSISKSTAQQQVLNKQLTEQTNKLNLLKARYDELSKTEDTNSAAMSRLRTQINNAQTDVNNTTKAIGDLGKETESTTDKVSKSGDGFTVFKGILANLGTQAINGAISGLKSLGSAFIDVGKQALESYSSYQQLTGGVETLFGDSAGIVEEYANNAYKTAGMGANEYMTTVTGFSASLLQSLNGDTKKVAEVSNMAVTDMSDNANKMGTSMESIQNAYQGFAKQNYTMLDNLKLGYGGTKSEMERLLADAEKFSGQKYDISNLNDVYQAIHVVQTEMGITGTTAKEASTTIEGSVNSMKSAWSNFVTGLADGNSNMQQLISNLVDSVMTVGKNIMPVIKNIVQSIIDVLPQIISAISEALPTFLQLGTELLTNLLTGIINNLPAVMSSVGQVIATINNTIISMLPEILNAGIQIIVSLIQGTAQSLPTLIPAMVNAVTTMVTTLLDNVDLIIDAGIQLLIGLSDGLIDALPELIDKIPVIIDKLITAIANNLPKLVEAGIKLTIKLAEGLIRAVPQLISKIPEIISSIVSGFAQYYGNMADIGVNMIQGIINGVKGMAKSAVDAVKNVGNSILSGIKGLFGIHSPSTVFRDQIGKNLALGLSEGFTDEMDSVSADMQNAIPTSFDTSINANVSGSTGSLGSSFNYDTLVSAFKDALSEMKVDLNGEEMGKFVDKTVANAVFV